MILVMDTKQNQRLLETPDMNSIVHMQTRKVI